MVLEPAQRIKKSLKMYKLPHRIICHNLIFLFLSEKDMCDLVSFKLACEQGGMEGKRKVSVIVNIGEIKNK